MSDCPYKQGDRVTFWHPFRPALVEPGEPAPVLLEGFVNGEPMTDEGFWWVPVFVADRLDGTGRDWIGYVSARNLEAPARLA